MEREKALHEELEHAELLMLYEQAVQDIRTLQDRQTSIANLTVLVYGALFAIAGYAPRSSTLPSVPSIRDQLPVVAVTAMLASVAWLVLLQAAIRRARGTIDRTRKHFSDAFKAAATGKSLATEPLFRSSDTLPVLIGVVVVGCLITIALLSR